MHGPDPNARYPFPGAAHTVFIKNVITGPNIEAGDYSYFHDFEEADRFQEKCVRYHFDFIGDRLIIGKFCAIASGVQFIMNGANHAMDGVSTYPFSIFQNGWEKGFDPASFSKAIRGDTIVGNDVWIGNGATILPGIRIGHGAIIGAKSVVATDVPDYAVVGGNPAKQIRSRFAPDEVKRLLELAWWDWPADKITRALPALRGGGIDALEEIAAREP
ncbi:CatB-related O-acetyltransferase [Roseibium litorale]|uniref:CatB-related O-acetyltransferase n=1 Tax=Roseibium litorale TaxID=2803841 RepID=A0ABR9CN73_9HYPH|nr:CatB-related O-acetyltransferase [Roseibium litorale]MBD8892297.1 CatB-related O-acetyltransferase [Roseibium litorale]